MKPIFEEFLCPKCGKFKILKINEICIDCRDKQIVMDILNNSTNKLATFTQ